MMLFLGFASAASDYVWFGKCVTLLFLGWQVWNLIIFGLLGVPPDYVWFASVAPDYVSFGRYYT
jgi:hypothetical protein